MKIIRLIAFTICALFLYSIAVNIFKLDKTFSLVHAMGFGLAGLIVDTNK